MKLIFVFGSNLAGRHGKGAALEAKNVWGAKTGVGEGLTGDSYALPTKDANLKIRSLYDIEQSILKLVKLAAHNHDLIFLTTPIGTGLSGYLREDIADIFSRIDLPANIVFTKEWFEFKWWKV